MLKRALRWFAIGLGGLAALLALAAGAVYAVSAYRMSATYAFRPDVPAIPSDAAGIARGQHLVVALAKCADCHGANLAGRVYIEDPLLGRLVVPNLTTGRGGLGAQLKDADWVRAMRHAVGPDGRPLLIMPSEDYYQLSDPDIAAIIAYARSLPPVDTDLPQSELRLLARTLYVFGQLPLYVAETMDHAARRIEAPPAGATKEYGRYLAVTGGCTGCHGPTLSGGPVIGGPPGAPPALNLTPGGEIVGWSEADFFRAMREGKTPGGRQLDAFMPWKATREMTDDEIRALLLYLRSVPAKPYGNH